MEIERKFLVDALPGDLARWPVRSMEQAYLCTRPVLRVRRSGTECWFTYKGAGLLAREEHEFPLEEEAYRHLLAKADGAVITKDRYRIPFGDHTIELDVFAPPFAPLVVAEVEFSSEAEAAAFQPPAWFGREVTWEAAYTNASLSRLGRAPDRSGAEGEEEPHVPGAI